MKPIQDEVWNAIKEIATQNNFQLVDRYNRDYTPILA